MLNAKIGVVDIKGGFGNQLFQVSFAKYLIDNGVNVYLNTRNFNRSKKIKNLKVDLRDLILSPEFFGMKEIANFNFRIFENFQKLSKNSVIKKFNDDTFELSKLKYLNRFDGYWQNSDYFNHSKNFLIASMKKNKILNDGFRNNYPKGSTALHVRRKDYLILNEELNISYYKEAINKAKEKIDNFSYTIFTDDEDFVLQQRIFNDAKNIYSSSSSAQDTLITFSEMLKFENFIVANSTFSLLAALINENKESTIFSPDPWFRNNQKKLNFKSTIKISNE